MRVVGHHSTKKKIWINNDTSTILEINLLEEYYLVYIFEGTSILLMSDLYGKNMNYFVLSVEDILIIITNF